MQLLQKDSTLHKKQCTKVQAKKSKLDADIAFHLKQLKELTSLEVSTKSSPRSSETHSDEESKVQHTERFTLRKLPIFTKCASSAKINFEWPTQAQFDLMLPDVQLKTLTFKSFNGAISSVSCTLTNNFESSVYEAANKDHSNQKTIEFNPDKPINQIRGVSKTNQEAMPVLQKIAFYD